MKKLDISIKSYLSALVVIVIMMCTCYALTFILPGGQYTRIISDAGTEVIDTSIPFKFVEGGLPFWKFLLSPILVLGSDGNITLISIIIFLFVIGGVFKCMEEARIMNYILDKITYNFIGSRYKLLAVVSFAFMAMGTLMGTAEEIIPMIPIMVSLCINLGFDSLTGLFISTIAGTCGFSTGVANPFTIGIAHRIAGIPMFSGALYRLLTFVVMYIVLMVFVFSHCKKIEKEISKSEINFIVDPKMEKATNAFGITMAIGFVCIILSSVITALQDYTMIIMALMFLIGGILSCVLSNISKSKMISDFLSGMLEIAPGSIAILMASSIKYILSESKLLDTIVYYMISVINGMPSWSIILCIFGVFLVIELFISSGSAKAFLLMPLILPVAQVFNISPRLTSLAFAFGDGFTNELYPTNAGVIISLSLADLSYKDYLKKTWPFFLTVMLLCCGFLVLGLKIGY